MKNAIISFCVVAMLLMTTVSHAAQTFAGYVSNRGTDAIRLKAQSIISYSSASGTRDRFENFDSAVVLPSNDPGGSYETHQFNSVIPDSIIPKDYGSTDVRFTYTNGGLLASDSIRIQLNVHGSAEQAMVGDPLRKASLMIHVGLSYVLLVDPDTASSSSLIRLTLPALPTLQNPSMETLSVELSGGTSSPVVMNPGDSARTLTLAGNQNWTYQLSYTMTVPHGTDPDFVLDLDGGQIGFSPIPEPTSSSLVALGVAMLSLRRRVTRA
jgi:hypothetical protein